MFKRNRTPRPWSPGLLVLFLLTAVPLVAGLGYALLYSLGLVGLLREGFTLQHWGAVLGSMVFWKSLTFSIYLATASMALAIMLALQLVLRWRDTWQSGWLSYGIYLPLTFPAMVVAFLVFQWFTGAGWFARLAYHVGLLQDVDQFPAMVNDPWGLGILLAHAAMATPFFAIFFGQLYAAEGLANYAQLAASLGASERQVRRRILIPVLLRRASPTLILYFVFVLGSYEIPLLLGSQSPQMISVLAIRKLQRFNLQDIPQAYVICLVYAALVLVVTPMLLRRFRMKAHE
ncbi:MAG: sugar ABC transporter permease [Lewinellaceae bacterium]|nr:sugar ABC transporter permease [Lewinellaceae bacterium]